MSAASSQPIAIAGGGIGGLAAALALARRNVRSHIFERRQTFSEDGAGIQLGPNATKVLTALGVADLLKPLAATPDALSVHDGTTGRLLARLPLGDWIRKRHGAPYWTVHRQDLHGALLDAAKRSSSISLTTSQEVQGFREDNGIVTAYIGNGEEQRASGLIAADGLWSNLRSQITPGAALQPTGKCAYRSVVLSDALPAALAANDVHIWLAPKTHAVHYPIRAGREIALVVCANQSANAGNWETLAPPAWQASLVANFPAELRALFKRAEGWRMWPLQSLVPLEKWSTGAVTVLGDSAHPVQPFLAQGGALALEDAATLAHCAALSPGNIAAAFRTYETERKQRAVRVARAAARNGDIYHLSGVMALARNALLRTAPAAGLMAQYDWLYGWNPIAP